MSLVEGLQAELRDWADRVVRQAEAALLDDLEQRVPVSDGSGDGAGAPGSTVRDQRQVDDTDLGFTVTYPGDVPNYLDEGTEPHTIPGNPLLAFDWGGQRVIVHSVNHPGSTKDVGWWSEFMVQETWTAALEGAASVNDLAG